MAAVIFSLIVSFKVSAQKIGIPASILLVLAVLQDRWHNLLPSGLKYFTYMDKMFVFAYLMTMVVLIHSVYCVNRCFGGLRVLNLISRFKCVIISAFSPVAFQLLC